MAHGNLAQSAALVGAVGSLLVLLGREKWALTGGFLALLLAEAGLLAALVPRHDLDRLNTPLHLFGVGGGLVIVLVGAYGFLRYPEVVPVALLLVAPFRLPVNLGGQQAFLLVPLYVVVASASLALVVRSFKGSVPGLPLGLAAAAAAFAALGAVAGFAFGPDPAKQPMSGPGLGERSAQPAPARHQAQRPAGPETTTP